MSQVLSHLLRLLHELLELHLEMLLLVLLALLLRQAFKFLLESLFPPFLQTYHISQLLL